MTTLTYQYQKYRGRCKEYCDAAVAADSTLTLARGHYYCPVWDSNEPHWWCVRADGTIFDPTVEQFPSLGAGIYTLFDGNVVCDQCGKEGKEEDFHPMGNYICCSDTCCMKLVGLA